MIGTSLTRAGRAFRYNRTVLRRLSLATKCLLLFGTAIVLIIVAALAVPWVRMNTMVHDV